MARSHSIAYPHYLSEEEQEEFGTQFEAFVNDPSNYRFDPSKNDPYQLDKAKFLKRWNWYLRKRRCWAGFFAQLLALFTAVRILFFPTVAEQRERERSRKQAHGGSKKHTDETKKEEQEEEEASDPFALLGLTRTDETTEKDVDKAFKKAALKFHPDRVSRGTAEEKEAAHNMMQRLNIARGDCLRALAAARADNNNFESEPESDDEESDEEDEEEALRRREQAEGYREWERQRERGFEEMLRQMREEEKRVRNSAALFS